MAKRLTWWILGALVLGVTVGLALHAAHPQDEWWDFEMPMERAGALGLRRAFSWFRNNW